MKFLISMILVVLLILYVVICINAIKDLINYFKEKKVKKENDKEGD